MDERMDRGTHRQTKNSYLGTRLFIELGMWEKSLSKKIATIYKAQGINTNFLHISPKLAF